MFRFLRLPTFLGLGLLAALAVALLAALPASAQPAAAPVSIDIGDIWFCDPGGPQPCAQPFNTTVDVGDTVTWEWGPGGIGTLLSHTTTHCPNDDWPTCSGTRDWDSGIKTSGTFSFTFDTEDAGKTFFYRCLIHSTMFGNITVNPLPTPTATPTTTATTPAPTATPASETPPSPTATATPPAPTPTAVLGVTELPTTGGEPTGGSSALPWLAVAIGALIVTSGGLALAYQRRRVR